MENNLINIVAVFSLAIIYTFLNDIDYKKNYVVHITAFLVFIVGIVSLDIIGVQILLMLLYMKFLIK